MVEATVDELLESWILHAEHRSDAHAWAWDRVTALVNWEADADGAWDIVTSLVRRAPEHLLGAAGAGPLEGLVARFAPELIARIEREARGEPKFRRALGHVWLTRGELPAEVEARLVRASDGIIEPLAPSDLEAADLHRSDLEGPGLGVR